MEPAVSKSSDLDNYIGFLYGGLEGYINVAAKDPLKEPDEPGAFQNEMFHYPSEVNRAKHVINHFKKTHEVYMAPALFKDKSNAKKENVKYSQVAWIDFDGNAPADWSDFANGKGPPSLIIESSIKGRQHVYWKLEQPLTDVLEIDRINRTLAYNFQADNSGWDAGQILRPPETYNHKRSSEVRILSKIEVSYDLDLFNALSAPPVPVTTTEWKLSELPNLDDVLLSYALGPDIQRLLKLERTEVADRSMAMQQLAYAAAELGMQNNEIFVILNSIDAKWGKYLGRSDRNRRLADIIDRARIKYPTTSSVAEEGSGESEAGTPPQTAFAFNYSDFLNTEIEIDFVIDGMLMEYGQMMFVGPSGVGKTQFLLDAMKHICIGKEFLEHKVPKPKKCGFLSLEMGHPDLQIFMKAQDAALTPEDRALLDQNLTIIPYGEAWPLNRLEGQERLKQLIEHYQWEGLFIDSIGSSVLGNISSNDVVQPMLNFADHIRNNYGVFLWFIHHTRKSAAGANNQFDIDDVYGDQYLVNRASSAYALLHGKAGTLKVKNLKNRLSKIEPTYHIQRMDDLTFKRIEVPNPYKQSGGPTIITSGDTDNGDTTAGGFVL